jgi:histidinol-phosphate aminotransferase
MNFDLNSLVRANIRRLKPYSSARSEFAGSAEVFLDANENAFGSAAGGSYNRYPDPLQTQLKDRISEINSVDTASIFIGNGSDEAIDLLFRIFCEPRKDSCIICPPTYGMYEVSADINDVAVTKIPLTTDFQLDVDRVLAGISSNTKLIFICSPNNPTGNLMRREDVLRIAEKFNGIVVIDEAYIHFADAASMVDEIGRLPNLVVLQTFSKAWGMAGLRVGMAFASPAIIDLMNRVKPPYNVSAIAQKSAFDAIEKRYEVDEWIEQTRQGRASLTAALSELPFVQKIYPTDANFLLVKVDDADRIYGHLIAAGIVVRNRSNVELCEVCLRITVGTPIENDRLMKALESYKSKTL